MSTGDDSDPSDLLAKKQEFLESFFKKGAEFTRELLRENDRLRHEVVQFQSQLEHERRQEISAATLEELVARLHALEEERKTLLERFAATEAAGGSFSSRYLEIEQENSDLASLYVAQTQLHASLDVSEVVRVIIEIVLNFIGGNRLALLVADGDGRFRVLAAEAVDEARIPVVEPGVGVIGQTVARGRVYVADDPLGQDRGEDGDPAVCLPLLHGDHVVGAVAIWSFWIQKEGLAPVDRQMFDLLSQSGGRALEAARIATQARRAGNAGPGRHDEYAELLR
jgi:hypothetical protein